MPLSRCRKFSAVRSAVSSAPPILHLGHATSGVAAIAVSAHRAKDARIELTEGFRRDVETGQTTALGDDDARARAPPGPS